MYVSNSIVPRSHDWISESMRFDRPQKQLSKPPKRTFYNKAASAIKAPFKAAGAVGRFSGRAAKVMAKAPFKAAAFTAKHPIKAVQNTFSGAGALAGSTVGGIAGGAAGAAVSAPTGPGAAIGAGAGMIAGDIAGWSLGKRAGKVAGKIVTAPATIPLAIGRKLNPFKSKSRPKPMTPKAQNLSRLNSQKIRAKSIQRHVEGIFEQVDADGNQISTSVLKRSQTSQNTRKRVRQTTQMDPAVMKSQRNMNSPKDIEVRANAIQRADMRREAGVRIRSRLQRRNVGSRTSRANSGED